MQTLTIKIKDDLVAEVINVLEQFKDNIQITKDKNLELDPYFYERQDKLHRIMDNNPSKLTNFEDFEIKMDNLELKQEFVWLFDLIFQKIHYQFTLHFNTYASMYSKQIFKWRETSTI